MNQETTDEPMQTREQMLLGLAPKTTPTAADREALARCYECSEDNEDTDVGRPTLDRLVTLGWLDKVSPARWEISGEGMDELSEFWSVDHA